jgi:hypothetical protein
MIKEHNKTQRVVAFLDRKEIDFLDKLGKDALFYNGLKIPRTKIIQLMVDILTRTNVDVKGIKTEQELKERILGAMREVMYFKDSS